MKTPHLFIFAVVVVLAFSGCSAEPDPEPELDADVLEDTSTEDTEEEPDVEELLDPECAPNCAEGAECVRTENCADEIFDRHCDRLGDGGPEACTGQGFYYHYPLTCQEGACAQSPHRVRETATCTLDPEGRICNCFIAGFLPVESICVDGRCDCTACDPVNGFCEEAGTRCCRGFCTPTEDPC